MTKIKEDGVIQNESKSLENKKSRTSEKTSKKSGLVPYRLQISNFLDDFQAIRTLMNALPRIP